MHVDPGERRALASVATMLTPTERLRVDAAGEGLYRAIHRDSVDDVIRDLRERRIHAVVISVSRCDSHAVSRVSTMVREFPRVPAVALLTQLEQRTAETVLALGRGGVQALVDAREPGGWRALRSVLLTDHGADIQRLALAQLALDLSGAPHDCWRFFETLFGGAPRLATVRQLARRLDVLPSTLMSRFFRARLPSPKRYLALARLTHVARLFENAGLSVANVANHLDYSSPQSFGRHVRTVMRMTAVEFRQRYDGEGMLQHFREELVLPHLAVLRTFTPLSAPPGWVSESRRPDTRPSSGSPTPRSG